MLRRSLLGLALAVLCAPAYSAELEIGAHAPEFKALPGVDGKEIVFVSADKQLMASRFYTGNTGLPEVGAPNALFRIATLIELDPLVWPTSNAYAVIANGRRFLVAVSAQDPHPPPIRVIVNWPALLTGRE